MRFAVVAALSGYVALAPPTLGAVQQFPDDGAPTGPSPSEPPARPSTGIPREAWLRLDELTFDLGFDAEFQRRQVRQDLPRSIAQVFTQLNEQRRFEESVGLQARGNLLGERVLLFDVGARWGVTQESYFEKRLGPDLRDDPNGDLLQYNVRLDLFPAGKITAYGLAENNRDRIPRRFLSTLERTRERYGGGVLWNDPVLPMRLEYEHLFDQIRGQTFGLRDDEDLGRDSLRYEATWQPSSRQQLRFEYEYDDREEKYSGLQTRFDTRRHDFLLNHTLLFGKNDRSRLDTLVRVQDESGDLARDVTELSPRLTLWHTDRFSTRWGFQYLRESFQQLTVDQFRGDAGLAWQIVEPLTANADFYVLRRENDEGRGLRGAGALESNEFAALLNLNYARTNDWGRFSAALSYNHTIVRTENGELNGVVISEAVSLRDPQASYLAQRNIDRFSILVTDEQRTRTYVEGRDYTVVQIGDFTSLRRVASGDIVDRQTVFATYRYRVFNNFDITRDRVDLRVQQEFKFGLTPYYAASIQNEHLDRPDRLLFRARNVNRHRIGASYRQRRWSAGLEYEYQDDSIDPYEAVHFNGDASLVDKAPHQLGANVMLSHFLFDGSGDLLSRDSTLMDLGVTYRYALTRNFEATAGAAYRFEHDTRFGETQGVDLTCGMKYRIGLFTLSCDVEYDLLDLPTASDDNFGVWLRVRREIPVIGRAR